ncbi:MAG: helix-turn-helix transcriptional regulator [Oscillospiraceae bacterium]|nr:helix-turn-helix transcriptional regulator [Oscillospiraceae bacterium]
MFLEKKGSEAMTFEDLRVREIRAVVRYNTTSPSWIAKDRKDHIVGIQLRGRAEHTFKFGNFEISEGSLYFLNRRDDYKAEVIEPCEAFSIHFTTYEEIDTQSFCTSAANPTAIVSILQKAELAKTSGDVLSLLSHLYRLCSEVGRAREKAYAPKDRRILCAKEYIDTHFSEAGCIDVATGESSLSLRRFCELFKNIYGVTPAKYLTSLKIEHAKGLLITGRFSVGEVSEMCNFSDIYYFSKVFKRETGMTPSEFIKKI